jgi:hypothetical protein
MPEISYLKKRIGQSYLVWFQNSNLYFQLEEPAWFVFRKTVKRHKSATIAREFAVRYGIAPGESLTFVKDIRSQIEKMNQHDNVQNSADQFPAGLNDLPFIPYSVHHYLLGTHLITFSFENRTFEHYIHPLIAHFETTKQTPGVPLFELFAHKEKIVFRHNGEVKGVWTKEETQFVKGQIFMTLVNEMHHKTDADWLMTVHASAITNGKKTILFSAAPGSGKTTIAALLRVRGYRLISDDFVPVDRSFRAYPFPITMSVKEGSMELLTPIFPELKQKTLTYISPEKSVRYLAPDHFPDVTSEIYPVHEFIFVQYDPSVDFAWEKLDPISGMKQLLQEAWVAPAKGNAGILFNRVDQISFYKLTYSNNQKALDAVTNLFDHD